MPLNKSTGKLVDIRAPETVDAIQRPISRTRIR